jgi:phosphate starvation-inducible protein PhoH
VVRHRIVQDIVTAYEAVSARAASPAAAAHGHPPTAAAPA